MSPQLRNYQDSGANGSNGHEASKNTNDFPIAIIGMACRLPQDAENTEKFWELLMKGRSATTEFPKEKMNIEAHYHPDPAHAGSTSSRGGHFLKHSGAPFDAPFFNITKSEAMTMDIQQRLIMENVYHAIENAGLPMDRVVSSETSVFVGAFSIDCSDIFTSDHDAVLKYSATGNSSAILSNRVSWFYDLKGTSISVDTACSSSLVAFHLGCQDLRNGNSEMSIVSGVNILENPDKMYRMSNNGFLSPDSKCYSFDHRANGYSRGEGVGTLIIKPLDAALRDGDLIRAVVRSTGLNQDGRTPGMTLPSKSAQESLIRRVYALAGLELKDTGYIEAHGTGTPAGDPIEASAIAAAWSGRESEHPLYIGAVKSNIGHLEGSSGVAGLIKTVMVLEKAIIPPNINFEKVNPKIQLGKWGIDFPLKPIPWPKDGLRRASVNSFGFGGTNAHAVLDDAYNFLQSRGLQGSHITVSKPPSLAQINNYLGHEITANETATNHIATNEIATNSTATNGTATNGTATNGIATNGTATNGTATNGTATNGTATNGTATNGTEINGTTTNGIATNGIAHNTASNGVAAKFQHDGGFSFKASTSRVFVLSSFDEVGIKRYADELSGYFSSILPLRDEGKYLDNLAYTLAVKRTMFSWKTFLVADSLSNLASGLAEGVKPSRHTRNRESPNLGFIFTGQGAQWHAMGRELLAYPIFKRSIEDAATYIHSLGCSWNLIDELLSDKASSNINHPILSQTLCTVLQVALVELLTSWKILPTRVIGHSSGEIAAAFSVGAIGREAAWRIAYFRGIVSTSLIGRKGAMMAVGISEQALQPYLEIVNKQLSGELVKACYNSPKNITMSGDESKVDLLKELLDADQIFARKLNVKNAYHSGHMKAVADEYLRLMGDITTRESNRSGASNQPQMFSTVTGQQIAPSELSKPQYWVDNMVSSVRFTQTLSTMCLTTSGKSRLRTEQGANIALQHLVEIGPHSALQSAVRDTLALQQSLSSITYSTILARNSSAITTSLQAVGNLFCMGYPVDLHSVNYTSRISSDKYDIPPQILTDLPPYSFNHSRTYWPEGRLSKNFRFRKAPRHDLLGAPVPDWDQDEPKWRQIIRTSELPWVKDHQVTGSNVYPGMGYIVMAIEAIKQLEGPDSQISGYRLRDVSIKAALQVPETEEGIETAFSMRHATESSLAGSANWWDFRVSSYNPNTDAWTEHCRGLVSVEHQTETGPVDGGREASAEIDGQKENLSNAIRNCSAPFDMQRAYSELFTIGLAYGPTFRNLSNVMRATENMEARGTITIPDVKAIMPKNYLLPHVIHPGTLDSMLHVFLAAIQDTGDARLAEPMVPVFVRELWVSNDVSSKPSHAFDCHGTVRKVAHNKIEAKVMAWDQHTNTLKVMIKDVQATPLQNNSTTAGDRQLSYNIEWKPDIDLLNHDQSQSYFKKSLPKPKLSESEMHQLQHNLNLTSTIYIQDALKELAEAPLGELPTHIQKYLDWLHYVKDKYQEGTVFHQTSEWELIMSDPARKEDFLAKHCYSPEASAEFRLAARIGSKIPKIIRQEEDSLQLMFGDDLLDQYYAELEGNVIVHQLLHSYLSTLGHKYVNLRVLEIGSGTGSSTMPVLQALSPVGKDGNMTNKSRVSLFTYTDISAGFFEKAKVKFKAWKSIMEFRRLDIEKDVIDQGFEQGSYDIVLAANVLHATTDLHKTLRNARKLLRPGGKLLLHEGVGHNLLVTPLAFGTLPGWWLSTEPNRKWGPLINEISWDHMLRESDFSGTDLALKDYEDDLIHSQSLIISSALSPAPAERQDPGTIVVTTQSQRNSPLVSSLLETLEKLGLRHPTVVDWREVDGLDLKNTVCISLLELEGPVLLDIDEAGFNNVRRLLMTCAGAIWVTKSTTSYPEVSIANGFIRTVRWERDVADCNIIILSFEDEDAAAVNEVTRQISKVFEYNFINTTEHKNEEYNSAGGILYVNRLIHADYINDFLSSKVAKPSPHIQPFGADPARALKLSTDAPGLLNRLMFVDDPTYPKPLGDEDVEVLIKATGLNFRDIMSAMGEVNGDVLGAEGAGIITRVGINVTKVKPGDRVMVMAEQTGCFQTYARSHQCCVSKIPDDMSFEIAASIPVIYATVLYCLNDIGHLKAGESILIHAAAGGVGQAAIMVAQDRGAEIFATVSTHEKRDILINTYGISEDHIFSSRDLSFEKGVMRMTKGRGVDVVLNSLAGEALRRTWNCIAHFGRFLEIGKRDIYSNGRLEMFPFSKSVTFSSCDLETVIKFDKKTSERLLEETVTLWNAKVIKGTTPFNVFTYGELEASFRLLQSGKHIGKVVLRAEPEDLVQALPKSQAPYRFPGDVSYVLAGGLGGLGRSIALWMVSQGARNLIFLSRSGDASANAKELVNELQERGCKVAVFACDISSMQSVKMAIAKSIQNMPPIKGCIQAAMQLKDSSIELMSCENFNAALAPKVHGSWNLHEVLPEDMQFFIMLSSISGIIGNRGQANYAGGNTYQDALACHRRAKGLPAISLDLGSMLSVGYIAENQKAVSSSLISALSNEAIREDEFHALLEYHVDPRSPLDEGIKTQVVIGLATSASFKWKGVPEPSFMKNPLFTQLHALSNSASQEGEEDSSVNTKAALRAAKTIDEAVSTIIESVIRQLSTIISLPVEEFDPSKPIHHYGVDSLVAVEFRNWFSKDMAADIPVLDIMGNDSIAQLSLKIAKTSKLVKIEEEME